VSKLQRVLASQEGQIQLLQRAHADAVHKLHASATSALDQGTMVGDKLSHVMQQLQHSQHHFATKEAHLQGALERANSSYVLESKLKRDARTAVQQKACASWIEVGPFVRTSGTPMILGLLLYTLLFISKLGVNFDSCVYFSGVKDAFQSARLMLGTNSQK